MVKAIEVGRGRNVTLIRPIKKAYEHGEDAEDPDMDQGQYIVSFPAVPHQSPSPSPLYVTNSYAHPFQTLQREKGVLSTPAHPKDLGETEIDSDWLNLSICSTLSVVSKVMCCKHQTLLEPHVKDKEFPKRFQLGRNGDAGLCYQRKLRNEDDRKH